MSNSNNNKFFDKLVSKTKVYLVIMIAIFITLTGYIQLLPLLILPNVLAYFNYDLKAKAMMGDTGSLLLGGAIASMALYLKMPLLLLIIALVPIFETISVMIQVTHFKRTGERVFKMTPIHHHFELSGWNENKIVSVFSLITLVCCIIGLVAI